MSRTTASSDCSIDTRRDSRLAAGTGIGLEALLGLDDAPFEQLLALVETGVAHLEVAPA